MQFQVLNVKPPLLLWTQTQTMKGSSNISLEKPRACDWIYPTKCITKVCAWDAQSCHFPDMTMLGIPCQNCWSNRAKIYVKCNSKRAKQELWQEKRQVLASAFTPNEWSHRPIKCWEDTRHQHLSLHELQKMVETLIVKLKNSQYHKHTPLVC